MEIGLDFQFEFKRRIYMHSNFTDSFLTHFKMTKRFLASAER